MLMNDFQKQVKTNFDLKKDSKINKAVAKHFGKKLTAEELGLALAAIAIACDSMGIDMASLAVQTIRNEKP